ncbi:hypothetical protein ACIQM4_07765 [Streptomyces sp. NPDC091272]|uniref:hypothetical protein n=1 Tax=Streptomyces sp. NPDC091272 TaxID=3365981 RepID=UPI003825EE11
MAGTELGGGSESDSESESGGGSGRGIGSPGGSGIPGSPGGSGSPAVPGQSVRLGVVTGSALTFGAHSSATTNNYAGREPDPAQQQLLIEVRELRADLERLNRTAPLEVLDAELVETENEITATGAATPSRLGRLLAAFAPVESMLALFSSATNLGTTVSELVAALPQGPGA